MNQSDEQDENKPDIKDKTLQPTEAVDNSSTDENQSSVDEETQLPATAQVVSDINSETAGIVETSAPDEMKEDSSEPTQTTETSEPTSTENILEPTPTEDISEPVSTEDTAEPTPIVEAQAENRIEPSETGTYQLDNAMVGKPYKNEIDLKELKIEESILSSEFEDQASKLGLSVKREGNVLQIEGVPSLDAQGEHLLLLDYTYDEKRIHRKKFTFLVNPDPKSLWKNIEPDEALPHRKEHTATEMISSKDFTIAAASQRGRSHAHEGKFREDDFAVYISESDWHIVIVADGAGSAKLSREGSRLACQTALESLKKSIAESLEPNFAQMINEFATAKTETTEKEIKNLLYKVLCGAAFASYKRLEQESVNTGNALKDYSTTLLISIVKKFAEGTFIASFGIGDGAIGVYDERNNSIDLMISPDGGEFSGQTRFLTMREVIADGSEMLRRVKFNLFGKFTMLALMTDGISDPKFGTDNNLISPEKWQTFGSELDAAINFRIGSDETGRRLLEYMDFWSPGEHDDRTLAILY